MKYTIKQGNHFADFTINRLFPFCCNKRSGTVKFSSSCLIQGDIPGWNKLTGISSTKIHDNSGRLVWRSDGSRIMIAGYVYNNGIRSEMLITSLQVGLWYDWKVRYQNDYYFFSIAGIEISMQGSLSGLKFKCYPYFGGQSTAPVDMIINV